MKKKNKIIILSIIILIFFSCLSCKEKKFQPMAINGVLDLRYWDLIDDGVIKLDGEWNFFWKKFVPPEKINIEKNSSKIKVPEIWFSEKIKNKFIDNYGYATYHLKILIDPIDTPLGIKFPTVGSAYEVYINGKKINSVGKIGKSIETSMPAYRPDVVDFIDFSRELDIVIYVSNFRQKYSGLWYSLHFGQARELVKMRESNIQISHFLIGVFFIIFLYHIGLTILRPQDKLSLFFAIICLMLALRTSCIDEITILSILPEISLSFLKKIEYLTFYLATAMGIFYVHLLFNNESNKTIVAFLNLPIFIISIITIFSPLEFFINFLFVVQIILVIVFLYISYVNIYAIIKKQNGAVIFFIGSVVFAGCGVNDILFSFYLINTGYIASYGLLFMIFAQSYLLSAKFSNALFSVEKLTSILEVKNTKLQDLNINLEKKVEERTVDLEQLNNKLKEIDKLKTNFFTNISHEIRTPLTLILSPVESIIQDGYKKEVDKEFFDNIQRNAIRLLRIINNILDFSKIEEGRMSMNIQKVDLVKVLKNYISNIQPSAHSRGIDLSFQSSKNSLFIFLDLEKLDKIGMNILSNSIKFTGKGGRVEIRIRDDDENCYIDFEDTGEGIPTVMLEKIFDRFSQVDGSSTRKYEGTGIGLSLAKEFILMHGGNISVQSKYINDHPDDHGTIFTITFIKGKLHFENKQYVEFLDGDVVKESISDSKRFYGMREMIEYIEPAEVTDASLLSRKDDQHAHLLIVEDNVDMRKFLNNLLKKSYIVSFAVDGLDGLNKAKELTPDLIITDVMMPKMNGYQMTQAIKDDEFLKRIPVLMLTAKAEITQKIEGLEYGADDYLTKPFNSKELMVRLKTLLEKRESQRIIEIRKDEMEKELEIARLLQQKLLPDEISKISGYKSHVTYIPLDRVGGDFYDLIVHDEKIELLIADVSGHGLPGAFLSMAAKISFENMEDRNSPKNVLKNINDVICRSTVKNNYITVFYCHLDRNTNELIYCNAGHFPPIVYRNSSDEFFHLKTKGVPLGWLELLELEEKSIQLKPGDRFFLYTDGIIECRDPEGNEFSEERFLEFIKLNSNLNPEELSEELIKNLKEYSRKDKFDDDVCLVVLDVL